MSGYSDRNKCICTHDSALSGVWFRLWLARSAPSFFVSLKSKSFSKFLACIVARSGSPIPSSESFSSPHTCSSPCCISLYTILPSGLSPSDAIKSLRPKLRYYIYFNMHIVRERSSEPWEEACQTPELKFANLVLFLDRPDFPKGYPEPVPRDHPRGGSPREHRWWWTLRRSLEQFKLPRFKQAL